MSDMRRGGPREAGGRKLWAAGICFGASATIAITAGVSLMVQTSMRLAEVRHGLDALTVALEESSRHQTPGGEDLSAAFEDLMERREAAEREARHAEMLAPYRDLVAEVEKPGAWVYGEPGARYTLYTYADPNCPHCQTFHSVPKQLVDNSRGVLNARYHHMTIMAANSTTQALASECAGRLGGNQHFWAMLDHAYQHPQDQRSGLLGTAEQMGFERAEFSRCLDSDDMHRHLAELAQQAQSEGVTGTPTSFLVDNQTGARVRITGAQPPSTIVDALRQLARQQATNDAQGT